MPQISCRSSRRPKHRDTLDVRLTSTPSYSQRMPPAMSTLLALVMLAAGYLTAVCSAPPNPPPAQEKRHKKDRISPLTGVFATIVRRIAVTVITYHTVLTLVPAYAPHCMTQLCPYPENLHNPLFTWSATSTISLSLIFVGAAIRLAAYSGLGRSFTFQLSAPDQLITTGVYRYMQHPSYTGQMLLAVGCMGLFLRWDATPACWIPESILAKVNGCGTAVGMGFLVLAGAMLGVRVRDEERMLKEKFGRQWVEWNRSTERFIPGLL